MTILILLVILSNFAVLGTLGYYLLSGQFEQFLIGLILVVITLFTCAASKLINEQTSIKK